MIIYLSTWLQVIYMRAKQSMPRLSHVTESFYDNYQRYIYKYLSLKLKLKTPL